MPADGPSQMSRHAVSGDGRYVVFTANAPALGYYGQALYLRDRRLSDTRLLFAGGGGDLRDAVISEDGRHVAFTVCEPWMRPDYAPICDVWAMDTLTGSIAPLSVAPHTGEFGNADSDEPVLSRNGRFIVFRTAATNLAPGVRRACRSSSSRIATQTGTASTTSRARMPSRSSARRKGRQAPCPETVRAPPPK